MAAAPSFLTRRLSRHRDEPGAAARAVRAPPIAMRIMLAAICLPTASPNGAKSSKSKRWLRPLEAGMGVLRVARRCTFWRVWTGFPERLYARNVPVLFMGTTSRTQDLQKSWRLLMRRRAIKEAEELRPGGNQPTTERLRHGLVERLDRAIADTQNNASRPYRALDTLAVMERRGSITPGMRQAGEDFRNRFATAHLDPLRALDITQLRIADGRSRGPDEGPGLRIEAARDAVWRAVQSVGGIASPAGSCIWHVVGWERSLKAWAVEQGWNGRRISQEAASGILVAALGALEAHFGNRPAMRKSHNHVDKSGSI
jgi:hypothetical protein